MALKYSPKIVTDGLVMCLDASQNKSYPTDLPIKDGLVMWMDAADDTTFSYSSGTTVSQWRDKSGYNYHGTPLTAGPTRSSFLNSRKVLAFTTGQSIGNLSFTMETSANTVFVVSRLTGTTNARVLTAYYNNWLLGHWGGLVNPYYAEGWVYYPPNAADTVWRMYMGEWGGPSNDVAAAYSNGTVLNFNTNQASAGPKGLGINFQGGEPSTCEAAEIIVFNRLLSATERKLIHTYLGQKWGILNTDRSIIDLSGNNNHGLLGNGTTANIPFLDYYNKGNLNFDGINDFVAISNTFLPADSVFSISSWVKIKVANTSALIDCMNDSAAYDGFALWITSGGTFIFYILKNTVSSITSNQSYSTDTWYNVVAIYNQSTIAIYINGVLDASSSYSSGFDVGSANIALGRRGINTNNPTSCNIAQISFYNKALNAAEVIQNYEAQKSKFDNTIVQQGLLLNLDAGNPYSYAGAGTTWYDVSGNNYTGSLTNGPVYNIANNGVIVFDGSNDYVDITTATVAVSGNGARSIFVWMKTTATNNQGFVATGNPAGSQAFNLVKYSGNYVGIMGYNNDYYPSSGNSGISIVDGNWHYIGATFDGTNIRTYVDGKLDNTSGTFTFTTTGQNNYIGRSNHTGNENFLNGSIGLTQIYNRALSITEVLQNYNATKGRFGL